MDWVVGHHSGGPAVANVSLGGGASTAVDDAVKRMIADGVTTAVAAGNGNQGGRAQDACNYSPARVPGAITVGATTKTDAKTTWSNYGNCVDWFAPGADITSAWIGGGSAETNTISGTSMATPHVAGVAALYLQTNVRATPVQVREALYAATTKGAVTSSKTANNHLLFTAY
jgi:subtilisin family serine protease